MPTTRVFVACAVAAAGLVLAGCGRSGPERYEVSGKVTYKNEPVDDGVVTFEPVDGQATGEGAQVQKDGTYRIPKDKGLHAGKYRVSIIIGDGSSGAGEASPDAPKGRRVAHPGKERAPKEFNEKSTQIREVKPGGPNTFDFDIP